MTDGGELLTSLPNRPLPLHTVEALSTHEAVRIVIPLAPRTEGNISTVKWFLLQTDAQGVLLEYVAGDGWVVTEQVTDDADQDAVYRALIERAIERQRERDGLWTAVLETGCRDLRDLIADPPGPCSGT